MFLTLSSDSIAARTAIRSVLSGANGATPRTEPMDAKCHRCASSPVDQAAWATRVLTLHVINSLAGRAGNDGHRISDRTDLLLRGLAVYTDES